MPDHLELTRHRTRSEFDARIEQTYLGQAHIAGTGPPGTTCRQCVFWHAWKWTRASRLDERVRVPAKPGYSGGVLGRAMCNKPIINKARRRVPHYAPSCRLFINNPEAPDATVKR
jgi:hypothetical protein